MDNYILYVRNMSVVVYNLAYYFLLLTMFHSMSSIVLDLLDCIKDDNTNTITNPGYIYLIDLVNFMAAGTIAAWLYLALMFTNISPFSR